MKPKIMYIENKSEGHSGSAWIGFAEFSKTGQTIYFNNKAFKKPKTAGIIGNHYDIETGEEYWISGIKKNEKNRHWAGGRKVMIDENCLEEYMNLINSKKLEEKNYIVVKINKTDKSRFNKIENEETEFINESFETRFWDNNQKKLL